MRDRDGETLLGYEVAVQTSSTDEAERIAAAGWVRLELAADEDVTTLDDRRMGMMTTSGAVVEWNV